MTTETHAGDAFDRRARALHAAAVEQVPARTLHQLRVRRAAAPPRAAAMPVRPRGWAIATAFAAVCAVAIGLRTTLPETPADAMATAGSPSSGAATAPVSVGEPIDAVASFDEDPDFYLWLASRDAQLLALE